MDWYAARRDVDRFVSQESVRPVAGNLGTQLYIGPALIAVSWTASWLHLGALGEHSFFPLWVGYILTVDGLVARRGRVSLLTRAPGHLAALFLASAPSWWLFEGINNFVLNWHYSGAGGYSVPEIIFWASLSFSTVMPAVFETVELAGTWPWIQRLRLGSETRVSRWLAPALQPRAGRLWALMYLGAALLLGVILLPRYFFPAAWIWAFLLLDPLNQMRGRASLIGQAARGDWRTIAALALSALICGFFWELWNYFAFPKWFYTVPFFDVGRLFEMPALGYLGYIPFSWELYALYHFLWGVLRLGAAPAAEMSPSHNPNLPDSSDLL